MSTTAATTSSTSQRSTDAISVNSSTPASMAEGGKWT